MNRKTILSKFRLLPLLSFFVFVSILLFIGCHKQAKVTLPPISQSFTGEYHEGKFVWFDLYTDDLDGCRLFYENLFEWSFKPTDDPNVKTILRDGVPIGNMIYSKPLNKDIKESRWLSFISVQDIDAVSRAIKQNSGTLYTPPMDVPDRGRICIAIDPHGAIFGMIKASGGDPIDQGLLNNLWMGSELWTTDKNEAVRFYHDVAGYDTMQVDMNEYGPYTFLSKAGNPMAGIVQITWEHVKPAWLPYIGVANVTPVAEKVENLGGKLLVAPNPDIREENVAVISDPSGAVFAIQQLPTQKVEGNE